MKIHTFPPGGLPKSSAAHAVWLKNAPSASIASMTGLKNGLMPGVDPEATPACVNICPVDARTFGDLNDPESRYLKLIADNPTIVLREELGTRPSVYYIPPKEGL